MGVVGRTGSGKVLVNFFSPGTTLQKKVYK